MLLRTDPHRELQTVARMFDATTGGPTTAMDAYRHGDVVTVDLDLPGVVPDSIDVQVERGELRIQATRRSGAPEGARFLVRERPEATVGRRIVLGDALDVESVDAEYVDGVLSIRMPLRETAKTRRIDVRHALGDTRAIAGSSA
ncbi:MAG TPA: Hsp20/alpha crystallin family protein [Iamia sp.]